MALWRKLGPEIIKPVCLHSNTFILQDKIGFLVDSAYKQNILITLIKLSCANLEQNV